MPYGLEIKHPLEADHGEVNHGRLYPNLDGLADDGLVEKGELDKRTNSYELTDAGRDLLEAQARKLQMLTGIGGEQP
jgi:DNA-binding PadR family transcriptional regulator